MRSFKPHPYHWIVEPLFEQASYEEKPMFGCRACYLAGELKLVLAAKKPPWRGVLLATEHDHHQSLIQEFPELSQHPVIKKWLYLSEDEPEFEAIAERLLKRILKNDQRIGVTPSEKSARSKRVANKKKISKRKPSARN